MILTEIDSSKIDNVTFNWLFRNTSISGTTGVLSDKDFTYPPVVAHIYDKYYQLNYFDKISKNYFMLEKSSLYDAVNISINLYNADSVNLVELSNLMKLADNFDISYDKLDLFAKKSIEGSKNIESIRALDDLSETIKRYIVQKNISLKTINILTRIDNDKKKIITEFISGKNPSVSTFKKFLCFLYDYSKYIKINNFDEGYFNSILCSVNKIKYDVINQFDKYKKQMRKISITNNNFETSELSFVFEAGDFKDYKACIDELNNKKDVVNKIYKLFEENDIC